MVVAAERSGMDVALPVRLGKTAGFMGVPFKRPRRTAGTVVHIAVGRKISVWRPEAFVARCAGSASSPAVIDVAVVKGCAMRDKSLVVVDGIVVMPVVPPVVPAPPVPAEVTDAKTDAKEQVRSAEPDSRIGIPSRPGYDSRTVHDPGIIGGHVHNVGCRRFDNDRRTLRGDGLLLSGAEVARLLRFLAHHLNGVGHILLLVVIG